MAKFNPDEPKLKNMIVHKSGGAGGMLVGKRHSQNGIKAINKSTGQQLEMEGGEVVITRDAVSDPRKRSFNGKMMTNREILSKINESGGGVSFADGGEIPESICFDCENSMEYGGETMCEKDFAYMLAKGGEINNFKLSKNKKNVIIPKSYIDNLKFNKSNFFYSTNATFIEQNKVIKDFDYKSNSGSKYKYTKDGVYRYSNHWGFGVATCNWLLNTGNYGLNNERFSPYKLGFCKWSNFSLNFPKLYLHNDQYILPIRFFKQELPILQTTNLSDEIIAEFKNIRPYTWKEKDKFTPEFKEFVEENSTDVVNYKTPTKHNEYYNFSFSGIFNKPIDEIKKGDVGYDIEENKHIAVKVDNNVLPYRSIVETKKYKRKKSSFAKGGRTLNYIEAAEIDALLMEDGGETDPYLYEHEIDDLFEDGGAIEDFDADAFQEFMELETEKMLSEFDFSSQEGYRKFIEAKLPKPFLKVYDENIDFFNISKPVPFVISLVTYYTSKLMIQARSFVDLVSQMKTKETELSNNNFRWYYALEEDENQSLGVSSFYVSTLRSSNRKINPKELDFDIKGLKKIMSNWGRYTTSVPVNCFYFFFVSIYLYRQGAKKATDKEKQIARQKAKEKAAELKKQREQFKKETVVFDKLNLKAIETIQQRFSTLNDIDIREKLEITTAIHFFNQEIDFYNMLLSTVPDVVNIAKRTEFLSEIKNLTRQKDEYKYKLNGGVGAMFINILKALWRGEKIEKDINKTAIIGLENHSKDVIYERKFKDWFGDWELAISTNNQEGVSKAVDKIGYPKIYYNGSGREKYTYNQTSNGVFYLAQNKSYAEWFARLYGTPEVNGYLIHAYVRLVHPIDLTVFGYAEHDLAEIVDYINVIYPDAKILNAVPKEVQDAVRGGYLLGKKIRAWQLIRNMKSFNEYVRDNTIHDGYLYEENNPQDLLPNGEENTTPAVAVFYSNQVKLLNATMFDINLDDFRFKEGGLL